MSTIMTQVTPETLKLLLSPSDLIILVILLIHIIMGAKRGLSRAVFGLLSSFGGFLAAVIIARLAAPNLARYLITPIVGDVFQKQAQAALSSSTYAATGGGQSLFNSLSASFQRLLDSDLLAQAGEPLETAVNQAAQSMAESLAYFLLFCILLAVFSLIFRIAGEALHLIVKDTPIGALNAIAGGVLGLLFGLALCLLMLWALLRFAPALFSELGLLSPDALDKTLLTKSLLRLIPQGLLGTV